MSNDMELTTIQIGSLSGSVYCADVIELLEEIGENSADIVFLDPPFNLGKNMHQKKKWTISRQKNMKNGF